jgi:hypothetical protein
MKFTVLALDYDGTIAEHGRLSHDVRSAIGEARARGIVTVVVTGRMLADLREASGDLSWADAFVCENGAVVARGDGSVRLLAPPVSTEFRAALTAAGVVHRAGECVIEADASDAPAILERIRARAEPLSMHFNVSRVMVLPHGVCKSAGLRDVLRTMRLSSHNVLAIGDAENDHDLLEMSEVGAAVAWGSALLKRRADVIVPGRGPDDVAGYVRDVIERLRLPPARDRRSIAIGEDRSGRRVQMGLRGRNLLVAGDPRSGKSWAVGLLCEQLILLGYSMCILDPEGDYAALESLPGVIVFGGAYSLPPPDGVVRALEHPDLSVVVDLSRLEHEAKRDFLDALLPAVTRARAASGLPHRIVIDEAHYFLARENAGEFIDFALGGYILVTYRVSDLNSDVLGTLDAVVLTHTTDPGEVAVLAKVAGLQEDAGFAGLLRDLEIDEAALVRARETPEPHVERFRLLPRMTQHVRHRAKYRDVPLGWDRGFVFTNAGTAIGDPARTLRSFVEALARVPDDCIAAHARRGDFSRWIADVFGDRALAEELAVVQLRPRSARGRKLRIELVQTISARYDVS